MPESLPNTPFEEIPELLKPPSYFGFNDVTTIIVCLLMMVFAYVAYLSQNWIGVAVDLSIIVMNIGLSIFRWRKHAKLHRTYKVLTTIHEILRTPKMQEIGNSVIFTVVFPSPELLAKLEKIRNEH